LERVKANPPYGNKPPRRCTIDGGTLKAYETDMLFEWDEAKSRRTTSERGFGFDYAARIFLGPTLEKQDDRRDYGEVRIQAIGEVAGDVLFVAYTDRGDARHVISARLASRKERRLWHSFAEQWKTSAD
jgi:uncharacterized DUF497 family protein